MIFLAVGAADFIFLLLFVLATGIITRRQAREAENKTQAEVGKKAP